MFEDFGCFIINDGNGSLKFYNGADFSNQYTKSQFSQANNILLGIDFKQKTLPLKVGLYWFTIEEYQEFLNCIDAHVVNYLTFSFEPNYSYLVKISSIKDSPRYIVGHNEEGKTVYYTEMDLNWDLVGDNCVRSVHPYEYNGTVNAENKTITWNFNSSGDNQDKSLLDTPILFELPFRFLSTNAIIQLKAKYNDIEIPLFEISLQNLTFTSATATTSSETDGYTLFIRYDSETGLLYNQKGDNDTWHLLNYQTNANTGKYLLNSGWAKKWKIPGVFSAPQLDSTAWQFVLTVNSVDLSFVTTNSPVVNTGITIYTRKNVI